MKAATQVRRTKGGFKTFQSTPPVKAATSMSPPWMPAENISIHAAREGGDIIETVKGIPAAISIHAAREGGDEARFLGFAFA